MEQITLNFIEKKKQSTQKGGADISITLACKNSDHEQVSLVFRNGAAEMIAPQTHFYVLAIAGNRLYFREADSRTGYTISRPAKQKSGYSTLRIESVSNWARIHEGDYSLLYDDNIKLFYIEDLRQWITKGGAV